MDRPSLTLLSYEIKPKKLGILDLGTRLWLARRRLSIWINLRLRYHCLPIKKTLWLIREPRNLEFLDQEIARWEEEFRRRGFTLAMDTLTLRGVSETHEKFKSLEMEFIIQWLGNIDEKLDSALRDRKIGQSSLSQIESEIELIELILREEFHKDFDQYNRAYGMVMIAYDKLMDLRPYVS